MPEDIQERFESWRLDQYALRLPEGMRDRIKKEAKQNQRSMNAEIIFQLSRAYQSDETKKADVQA